MSDESKKETLRFEATGGTGTQIDTLRGLIPANWKTAGDGTEKILEADLGDGLPTVRLEEDGDTWVGIVDPAGTDDELQTEACDSHNAAALHLRQKLLEYGERLRERADELVELAQSTD